MRKPNKQEKRDLAWYIAENNLGGFESDDNLETSKNLIENASIAVFDNYISDCPGYTGKVIMVVFGYPEAHSVYGYREGKLIEFKEELSEKGVI